MVKAERVGEGEREYENFITPEQALVYQFVAKLVPVAYRIVATSGEWTTNLKGEKVPVSVGHLHVRLQGTPEQLNNYEKLRAKTNVLLAKIDAFRKDKDILASEVLHQFDPNYSD